MASLAFNMQPQQAQNWCWSAVSVSVDFFYNTASTWQQCLMAQTGLGQPACCANPVPQPCDQPWYLDRALSILGRLLGPVTAGPLPFSQIQTIIGSGHPIGVRIGWPDGTGHFVVISGWSLVGGQPNLNIEDPFFGQSTVDYATFCTGYHYGQGTWTHTYPV